MNYQQGQASASAGGQPSGDGKHHGGGDDDTVVTEFLASLMDYTPTVCLSENPNFVPRVELDSESVS
ncbi:hypothetical protein MLD38_019038 [Melastoma candidum]|uniref:Uncharacterized protein n=1 Tax=Melastoma candidum TaxID=119954 RepID=A0ACB9QVT7_9MYRT|nr:hypothetical protein MLD38_019038 [Melastoma candidum]